MSNQNTSRGVPLSQKSLRVQAPQDEVRDIYILVMGLTGAGKSTFISIATGIDSIPIGEPGDLDSVTDSVQDYIFTLNQKGIVYRVHLIDSPGFDDGTVADVKVLTRIADFINLHYKLGSTLSGVLYLHDITKEKMGGVGVRNLRMLEELIGIEKWDNCTLVTTKWGCTTNPAAEEAREGHLMKADKFFGAMLNNSHQASMKRFNPKSKGTALEIIKPHLRRRFEPLISVQMVKDGGPKMSLGETNAGQIVADYLENYLKEMGKNEELEEAHRLLGRNFDNLMFEKFKRSRDKLLREQKVHKVGRWATRTTIVGGAIAATVVTFGPGAAAFALEPAFETYATRQRHEDQSKMADLQKKFEKEYQNPIKYAGEYDSAWIRDKKVQSIGDLSDNYSVRSSSSTDLTAVVDTVTDVATDLADVCIKDTNIP